MNPVHERSAFLAVFALRYFADTLAEQAPGADEMARDYAECVDVNVTTVKYPHVTKRNGEEGK